MSELIHFAHGNGFPSLCYKQMLDHLQPRFNYCVIDKLGHNPNFPVADNWHNLVLEVIASIKSHTQQPIIAIGHSLGGALSLLAAMQAPELFKAVIMLDSPILGPFKSTMLKLTKAIGLIDRVTPAYKTRGRRQYWRDYDELVHYLRLRDLFKHFTDACLDDYINYGMELKEDGYHLRFDRGIEYQIYRTIPHILPSYEGKLLTPTALIYGDKSTVVGRMEVRYMKKHFNVYCTKTKGSHLFPMEHPRMAAKRIIDAVDAIINT